MRIITAQERLSSATKKNSLCIFGPTGVGKTSLLHTLDAATTLFIDLEAGDKAVQTWEGDTIRVSTFEEMRDLACFISGPSPAKRPDECFSENHYNHLCKITFAGWDLSKYQNIFIDSLTDLSRLGMQWAKGQPAAFSEKTGKPDVRGAYGLLGRDMVDMLKRLHHTPNKTIIFVAILEKITDDFHRETWVPQMEGSKIGRELPGIVDQVVTMSIFDIDEQGAARHNPEKGKHRAFVCQTINGFGLPAKDRSGSLEMLEAPDLGKLLEKINAPARSVAERLVHTSAVISQTTA